MYYLVLVSYVGPNLEQNLGADVIEIRNEPARTNSSHEVRIDGWCGTTNDWSVTAYGEYRTLRAARGAIKDRFGQTRRCDGEEVYEPEPWVVEAYRLGRFIPMNEEETGNWVYGALKADVGATTTDEEIERLCAESEDHARAEGYTLSRSLQEMMAEYRNQLLIDRADED